MECQFWIALTGGRRRMCVCVQCAHRKVMTARRLHLQLMESRGVGWRPQECERLRPGIDLELLELFISALGDLTKRDDDDDDTWKDRFYAHELGLIGSSWWYVESLIPLRNTSYSITCFQFNRQINTDIFFLYLMIKKTIFQSRFLQKVTWVRFSGRFSPQNQIEVKLPNQKKCN